MRRTVGVTGRLESMMDPLDAVAWSETRGPYGPCTTLPDLLRRLQEHPSEDDAWELFHSITHQGTVYPVTPVALPFVFDILRVHPHGVLLVTVQVALAGRGWWQIMHGQCGQVAPEGSLEAEEEVTRAIRTAVSKEQPLVEDLCRHEAVSTRRSAIPVLAQLDPSRAAALMAHESDSTVRACANLALRQVGRADLAGLAGDTKLERVTAALAHPESAPEVLLDAIGDGDLDKHVPDDWPIDLTLAYEAAAALTVCRDIAVLDKLVQRFPTYHWTVITEAGEALLALAQRHGQLPRAASVLAATDGFWMDTMRLVRAEALRPYGLPADRDELRAWAGARE